MSDLRQRRVAAGIVEDALCAVFDPQVVRQLREDSPLDAIGMTPADAVCVADAVSTAAGQAACRLDDADLARAVTVGDLVTAVHGRLAAEGIR